MNSLSNRPLNGTGKKFALIASRFNSNIVEALVKGAQETLLEHGTKPSDVDLYWVPGALEIPIIAQTLARTNRYSGFIALGAVIQGASDHYTHVSREVHQGITQVSLTHHVPITMAVLTTLNLQQALERAGGVEGNVGSNAALALLETVQLMGTIHEQR